jgi:hypothetical protein
MYARARELQLRTLQASSSPTEVQPTNHGRQSTTPTWRHPYFPHHLQEELSGAFQKLPAEEGMAAKAKEEVLCTYLHICKVLKNNVSLISEHVGGDDGDDGDAQDEGAGESRAGRITAKDIWGLT